MISNGITEEEFVEKAIDKISEHKKMTIKHFIEIFLLEFSNLQEILLNLDLIEWKKIAQEERNKLFDIEKII